MLHTQFEAIMKKCNQKKIESLVIDFRTSIDSYDLFPTTTSLDSISQLSNLTLLQIGVKNSSNIMEIDHQSLILWSSSLTKLKTLRIINASVSYSGLASLLTITSLKDLKLFTVWDLEDTEEYDSDDSSHEEYEKRWELLDALPLMQNLIKLDLNIWYSSYFVDMIPKCTKLESLSIVWSNDAPIQYLSTLTTLTHLSIEDNSQYSLLMFSQLTSLRELSIPGNLVVDPFDYSVLSNLTSLVLRSLPSHHTRLIQLPNLHIINGEDFCTWLRYKEANYRY